MPPDANASLPTNTSRIPRCCPIEATILSALVEIAQRAVDNQTPQPLPQSSGRGRAGKAEREGGGGRRSAGRGLSPAGQPDLQVPRRLRDRNAREDRIQPGEVRDHKGHIATDGYQPERSSLG